MPTRLKKLRINRVDVVDRGANALAKIALYKREEGIVKDDYGHEYTPRTVGQVLAEREAKDAWYELLAALECSVREITGAADPAAVPELLTQTVSEFSQAAKDLIPKVSMSKAFAAAVENIEKAGRVIASERLGRLKAAMTALAQIIREAEPEEKDDDMEGADLEKRAKDAEAETAALKKQLAEATAKLEKGDPEALAKRLADAEKAVEIEKAKREEREYIEKASRYTTLPVKPEDDWRVFKAIDGLDESVRDRLTELLHAADGQLAIAGALAPVGKGGERRGGSSAWDEAKALASGIVSKNTSLSFDDAIAQVWRERPALYDRHCKESAGRA